MMNFFTSKGLLKGVFPDFNEFQDISVNINFNVSQVWSGLDIANFVLGLIDGALSALPQGSAGYWCSKNSTSSRISFTNAVSAFNNNNDIANGLSNVYNGLKLLNGISVNCVYAFLTTMNDTYWSNYNQWTFINVFTNNLGYMYTDLTNIITNNWQT